MNIDCFSYDQKSMSEADKQFMYNRFSATLHFVEDYLCNVIMNMTSFNDPDQNKLTFEVSVFSFI